MSSPCAIVPQPLSLVPGKEGFVLTASSRITWSGEGAAEVAGLLAEELGLGAPPLPWHTGRLRLVQVAAAAAGAAAVTGKLARDVTLLAQSEIAEVSEGEYKDSWQSAQIGFAVVANEKGFTQSMVQKVLDYVDSLGMAKLVDDEQDYIDYGSERAGGEVATWEPSELSEDDFLRRPPGGSDGEGE